MRANIAVHIGSRWNFTLLVVMTLLLARAYPADAQNSVSNPPPCPSDDDVYGQVKVTKASTTEQGKEAEEVELGNAITVEVENLKLLFQKAQCKTPKKNIVLFLDERPVKDAVPFPLTYPGKQSLVFSLQRTEFSRDTWTYLLSKSRGDTWTSLHSKFRWASHLTAVSVGFEDGYALQSCASIRLQVIPIGGFIGWLVIFLLILIAFWVLASKSDVLRDVGPQPTASNARKPYSLARTQAAWWFFVILSSYLFIGMMTGDFSTIITGTVLGLLGISAGTVVGSASIDAGKASTSIAPAVPDASTAPAAPTAPAVPAAPGALPAGGPASAAPQIAQNKYWWVDILSDANGVSFHRFQIAAWTLVLGIIFIVQVWQDLAMPDFNGSLLALLGISAGTYLGGKISE